MLLAKKCFFLAAVSKWCNWTVCVIFLPRFFSFACKKKSLPEKSREKKTNLLTNSSEEIFMEASDFSKQKQKGGRLT